MNPIQESDPEAHSPDLVAENIAALKALFPELITEGEQGASVNVDVLKDLVGDQTVTNAEEKYGLNWFGKRRARQLALTPSTGTLRPCPEESVDWDTTQNLMIEGDNLEVLKLLQKSYAGKVKLIYIDPPYNTGRDFVYPDDYRDNIRNYLELTGQKGGGRRLTTNTESSGRFHTDWLTMMYPRLRVARSLLAEDGALFISIDDTELDNLRMICSEIFGEDGLIAQVLWRKRSTPPNDKVIGANHDYVVLFAKDISSVMLNLRARTQERLAQYKNPDNHPKGPWVVGDLTANVKGGRYSSALYFGITNPNTGVEHFPGENGNWRFGKDTIERLVANRELYFGEDGRGRPKLKRFLCDIKEGITWPTIWDFVPLNGKGSEEMARLFGDSTAFENPKPLGLISELIALGSSSEGIVVDFFAGSGTTAHAVLEANSKDGGRRRFILVQLPEPMPDGEFPTISALTAERVRRAAREIRTSQPLTSGDVGFRVFKLDSTNIQAWDPDRNDIQGSVQASLEHLKADRTEQDILYEILLKLALDLCVPIETREIAGKTVHSVGAGVLIACLATHIAQSEVEELGIGIAKWREELAPASETTCVFRDSAFPDDVAKTNLAAILEQRGIDRRNIRSL